MRLPRIYEHFRQGQIFTIEEARTALQITGNTLRKRLSELALRGYICQIRQGLYRLSFPGEDVVANQSSPFLVGSKVAPYCYIGFKSALQFHSGERPPTGDTVYVVSATKFNSFQFEGRNYFWCQSPDPYGLETKLINERNSEFPVLVTNFEKSIVDCIKRPLHSPAFEQIVALCSAANRVPDPDKLFQYSCDYQVAALFNRVGYFLEVMKDHWNVGDEILVEFERRMSRKQTDWPIPLSREESGLSGTSGTTPTLCGRSSRWRVHFTGASPSVRGNEPTILRSLPESGLRQ